MFSWRYHDPMPLKSRRQGRVCTECDLGTALSEIVSATAFHDLLRVGGLGATLARPGPFTLFVPTNAAMALLPADLADDMCHPDAHSRLVGFLTRHFVIGLHPVHDLIGLWRSLATLWGDTVTVDGTSVPASVEGVPLSGESYATSNGVIHMIGEVLPFSV